MLLDLVRIVAGLALLTAGAEALVTGASGLARRLGVSPLVIGLTIVAFGTSAPELVVSIHAALSGLPDVSLGNVVGSNSFNVLVVLGAAAVVRPLKVTAQVVRIDGPVVIVSTLLLALMLRDGQLDRIEGALLLALGLLYTWASFRLAERDAEQQADEQRTDDPNTLGGEILRIGGGGVALVVGSRFLVDGAIDLALALGIGQDLVALTIVAAGTSLPELITSIVAARRGEDDIAVGNALGSCTFNVLVILGVSGLLHPLVPVGVGGLDLGVALLASVAVLPMLFTGWVLSRAEGAVLLSGYGAYLAVRIFA